MATTTKLTATTTTTTTTTTTIGEDELDEFQDFQSVRTASISTDLDSLPATIASTGSSRTSTSATSTSATSTPATTLNLGKGGNATRSLLCSDLDDGYTFLEFVKVPDELAAPIPSSSSSIPPSSKPLPTTKQHIEKTSATRVMSYFSGLWNKKTQANSSTSTILLKKLSQNKDASEIETQSQNDLSSLTDNEQDENDDEAEVKVEGEHEEEKSEACDPITKDQPAHMIDSMCSEATIQTIHSEGDLSSLSATASVTKREKKLDNRKKKSSMFSSSFAFSSAFSGLSSSISGSPRGSSPSQFFYSFSSYYKERKIPPTRSECNRVALSWFDQYEPQGYMWQQKIEHLVHEFDSDVSIESKTESLQQSSEIKEAETETETDTDTDTENENIEKETSHTTDIKRNEGEERKHDDQTIQVQQEQEQEQEQENEQENDQDDESSAYTAATSESPCSSIYTNQPWLRSAEIDRDIPRTYPTLAWFQKPSIQQRLSDILRWVLVKYPNLGYVQGMNYIVAQLVLHCPDNDEQVKHLFDKLLMGRVFNMYGLYETGLSVLQQNVDILKNLIEVRKPNLLAKLEDLGMGTFHFTYNWFITLFSYTMPFETLCQVWDLFFEFGWPILFKASLVLILEQEKELMAPTTTIEVATNCLRAVPIFPPKDFVAQIKSLQLTPQEISCIRKTCCRKL